MKNFKTLQEQLEEQTNTLSEMVDEALNENELFEMANFTKSETSLPMVIWIQPKTPTRHKTPRMKFANNNSDTLIPKDLVSISISDNPQILTNTKLKISLSDFEKLRQWIIRNKVNLLKVWNYEMSTNAFGKEMK